MKTRIEMLRDIVQGCQAQRIRVDGRKVYVDLFSASAMVKVYDALNEANRAKYIGLSWPVFVDVTWKLVGGGKGTPS